MKGFYSTQLVLQKKSPIPHPTVKEALKQKVENFRQVRGVPASRMCFGVPQKATQKCKVNVFISYFQTQ